MDSPSNDILTKWASILDFTDKDLIVVNPHIREYVADMLNCCEDHFKNEFDYISNCHRILRIVVPQCRVTLNPIKYSYAEYTNVSGFVECGLIIHNFKEWVTKLNVYDDTFNMFFINFNINNWDEDKNRYFYNRLKIDPPKTFDCRVKTIIDRLGMDYWEDLKSYE